MQTQKKTKNGGIDGMEGAMNEGDLEARARGNK
jgi:hypothetical protein